MKFSLLFVAVGVLIIAFNDRLARAQEDKQRELWGDKYSLGRTKSLTIAAGVIVLLVGLGGAYFEYTLVH